MGSMYMSRDYVTSLEQLSSEPDVRLIGILLASAGVTNAKASHYRSEALKKIFLSVNESSEIKLTYTQFFALSRMLRPPLPRRFRKNYVETPQELRLAILHSFRYIGDARAMRVVEKLAASRSTVPDDVTLRDAARECLPYMRERLERAKSNAALLRPASAPDDTLLRPASATASDAATLVRAADAEQAVSAVTDGGE